MAKRRNKVRAIIFSDLHQELWKKFNEHNRRLDNSIDVLKVIKKACKIHKCPALFLGDLLHKERGINNELLESLLPLYSKLWGSGVFETYAITGNHDQSQQNLVNKQSPSYIKTLSNTFKGMHCMDFKQHDFGDWTISGVPYLTHDIGLLETVQNFSTKKNKFNVLLLHTTMPNAKDTDDRPIHSNLDLNEFEKAIIKFDMVLCGHIHKPHHYRLMTTDIIQVGSPQHQRLTDRDCDMGYWILYENWDVEFVHMKKYPRFVLLEPKEKRPDNSNFYVNREEKKEKRKNKKTKDFSDANNKRKLARNYMAEKSIKDKRKRQALIKALK